MALFGRLFAALLLAYLGACGGGGGSSGTSAFGGGGSGGGTTVPAATAIVLTLSAGTIANDGSQTVTATVQALDSNNNTLAGVPVTISADTGVVTPSGTVTDTAGAVTATIGIGSNRTNRTINLTATSAALTQVAQLQVASASGSTGVPRISLALSSSTVTSAAPVTVTAVVYDAAGNVVPNTVVSFATSAGMGAFNASTALTNSSGLTSVALSPAVATVTGADYVVATAQVNGVNVSGTYGFSLVATVASISSFTTATGGSAAGRLSAYGQTVLTVNLSGASVATPVTLVLSSVCVASGKAKISPATFTATSNVATFTYLDTGGCGATVTADTLTASISGATAQQSLQLYLSSPSANNIVFVSASPSIIYLQGAGLTTSSKVVFQVNDAANNPLPGQVVTMALNTYAGGLTINSGQTAVTQTSDSSGQVTALINSGTVPSPVVVKASLPDGTSTVSKGLAVQVGLPSQLNFSLSQKTINIEGYNLDGVKNVFTVIASDRLGNPVADGTAINFVTTSGQVQPSAQTATVGNLSQATANFQTSQPKPIDGRVTVLAYAIGEESFLDTNGNNIFDTGELFQDLGDPFLNRKFNGAFDPANDQYFSLGDTGATQSCATPASGLLALDMTIPNRPGTCTASWGRAYVRRAVQTIFSTSGARPRWGQSWPAKAYAQQLAECPVPGSHTLVKDNFGLPDVTKAAYNADGSANAYYYRPFGALGLYGMGSSGAFSFWIADANPVAFNPMPAGSTITVSATTGLTATLVGGSPVPNTLSPSMATISYSFDGATEGTLTVTITSPNGLATTFTQYISTSAPPAGSSVADNCPSS